MPRVKKEKETHQVIVIDDDSDDNGKNAEMADAPAKSSPNQNGDDGSSTASHIEEGEDDDDEVFDVDDLMPVPKPAAKKSRFPPGCSVVVVQRGSKQSNNHNGEAGKVVQVVINFTSKSRPNLFQVELNTAGVSNSNTGTETIVLTEKSLRYAPGCPVWLSSNHAEEDQNAVVLGSEYYPADPEEQLEASVLYSIQTLGTHIEIATLYNCSVAAYGLLIFLSFVISFSNMERSRAQ